MSWKAAFQRYRQWIAPPVIEGFPAQTRAVALLNRLLLMFIYVFAPLLFIGPFIFPVWYAAHLVFGLLVCVWLLARYLTVKGYFYQFSVAFVALLWLLATGAIHVNGGLYSAHTFSYATVIIVAGMLLGGRGGLIATFFSIFSLFLSWYLATIGRLPVERNHPLLEELFVTSSNLMVVALFQYMSWRSYEDALDMEHDLAQKAIAADKYKTDLVARVNHELRTPLGAIIGLADMLKEGAAGEVSEEQALILQKIAYNGEYLHRLVNDLLKQSHLAAGKLSLKYVAFSPLELARRVSASLETHVRKKELQIVTAGLNLLPDKIMGDPARLEEVFANIIMNAVKFTERGVIQVAVSLPDERHWRVDISDTGIGMPPEVLDSIFEPFRQVGNTTVDRKFGGVGLGLSIAQQLVELMDGEITVASQVGKGSMFTVTLPLIKPAEEAT